jgi:putative hydrolase of the HAD superfamily
MPRDFHLDDIFHERVGYVDHAFDVYRRIYDLPEIEYVGDVSSELFNYVKKRRHFLLLSIYDCEGRIFLERNIQEQLYWSLPGGSLKTDEDFHLAIERIAKRISEHGGAQMMLGEIEPIAFVRNIFRHEGEEFEHLGIAFAARLRNQSQIDVKSLLGRFVHINDKELESINRYANREVAKLCHKRIDKFDTDFPEAEIATNEKFHFRYMVHDNLVKRFLLTPKLKKKEQFHKMLKDKLGGARSFLDVSCGDNDLIFRLSETGTYDYLVGNDVSWSQINTKRGSGTNILFTNHNASYLPFKEDAFDVLYCGNTLHHMTSRRELELLFDSCLRVSKKIVIVEIEKPSETGLFPHLLNTYWYRMFLKDVGGAYLSKDAFHSIVSSHFKNKANVAFGEFSNIQGRYLIAEVTKIATKSPTRDHLEVEEKFFLNDPSSLENHLKKDGFTLSDDCYETDEYFTDLDGQFVIDRTCLRLRTQGGHCEITFKGKSKVLANHFAKVERNITIDPEKTADYKKLLASLGYHKYSSVIKHRRTFSDTRKGLSYSVAIDCIENVGSFVEFEITAPVTEWEGKEGDLRKYLVAWLAAYHSEEWDKADKPYRDFVAEHVKQSILKSGATKAMLIDFDGTIVPSEKIFFRAYRDAVQASYGYSVSLEEYKEHELSKSDGLFAYLQGVVGAMEGDKEGLMERVYANYEAYSDCLLSDDDVMANLSALGKLRDTGLRLALVTTSKRKFVEKILRNYDCSNLFELMVCREDVVDHKPSPAAFELAVEKLGLPPNECVAFEDSRRGVASAKSANLTCFGVHNLSLTSKDELSSMEVPVFESLMEVVNILRFA